MNSFIEGNIESKVAEPFRFHSYAERLRMIVVVEVTATSELGRKYPNFGCQRALS